MKISNKQIINFFSLLILDLMVFIFCGVYMIGYDDFYSESHGEYLSFSSMTYQYKVVWAFYNIWLVLNGILLLYFLYKLCKKLIQKEVSV